MYLAIPDSELAVVPGTSHFFLQEKPEASNAIIRSFLVDDPVTTIAPVRRTPAERRPSPSPDRRRGRSSGPRHAR